MSQIPGTSRKHNSEKCHKSNCSKGIKFQEKLNLGWAAEHPTPSVPTEEACKRLVFGVGLAPVKGLMTAESMGPLRRAPSPKLVGGGKGMNVRRDPARVAAESVHLIPQHAAQFGCQVSRVGRSSAAKSGLSRSLRRPNSNSRVRTANPADRRHYRAHDGRQRHKSLCGSAGVDN